MSDQGNGQAPLQCPTTDDPEAWKAYWEAKGWRWRTEPEINADRQNYLAERRAIVSDIKKGIYPFKDVKLSRADVEWLLVTHENGRGPVNWSDVRQRKREGLDVRCADLRNIDLHNLPLARLRGSLKWKEGGEHTEEEINRIAIRLRHTDMRKVHLEGAILTGVNLEKCDLRGAYMEEAYLIRAHLEKAMLLKAHLERANLTGAYLEEAYLAEVFLGDDKHIGPRLLDTHWNNVNLSIVNWTQVEILDDECRAKQLQEPDGRLKSSIMRLQDYGKAVRANRQLAVALQAQGVNEDAARFAYRAQMLQRVILRRQKKFGQYLFSGFLDLLAGYGYRPGRAMIWYLATILVFALAYHLLGGLTLYPPDAFVFSIMSFHGRGFFPSLSQETNLHNPLVMLAAAEAIIGLLIEISFIATFTQRFFGR